MKRDIESALEDCIAALHGGESLEEALRRHPEQAEEIRSLIESSLDVGRAEVQPDYLAMARGRRHFFQAAARKRASNSHRLLGAPLRYARPLAAVFAGLALAALAAGGGLVYQASNAEPGDSLYGTRLLVENLRLRWPLYSDDDRAGVILGYMAQRYDELLGAMADEEPVETEVLAALEADVRDLLAVLPEDGSSQHARDVTRVAGRGENLLTHSINSIATTDRSQYLATLVAVHAARVYQSDPSAALAYLDSGARYEGVTRVVGTLEDIPGGLVSVGGVPMRVDDASLLRPGAYGSPAVATAAWYADGSLHALTISSDSGGEDQDVFVAGQVESYLQGVLTVSGQRVRVAPDSIVVGPIRLGALVEVSALRNRAGTLVAEVATVRDPALQESSFVYEGYLQAVGDVKDSTIWQVGGQYFRISSLALIDTREAPLAVGAYTRVEASRFNGQLTARRLHVVSSPPGTGGEGYVRLRGRVEEVGEDNVVYINGIPVRVDPLLSLALSRGGFAEFEGKWDGKYLNPLPEKTRFIEDSRRFTIEGLLTAVEADAGIYRIGRFAFRLDPQTLITGTLAVGARISVQAVFDEEGTAVALRVDVLRNPPRPAPNETPGQGLTPGAGPDSETRIAETLSQSAA
ncbi:MAG: DUF5666 domain-containing protein [Dehalococcoidia bacterium]